MPEYSPAWCETVAQLSNRIIEAQKPIRILDAIKWDDQLKLDFFKSKCKQLPKVDAAYYRERNPLEFNPDEVSQAFGQIGRDVNRQLGELNPLGRIMARICREYRMVVQMLEARGTARFHEFSAELYGSAHDVFHAGDPSLAHLGTMMEQTLDGLVGHDLLLEEPDSLNANQAVAELAARLERAFPKAGVRVMVSDGIVADAAAGTDYLKIRSDARFSTRDLDILEVHEGWVHLGTTLNGQAQPWCRFLAKGPPSAVITQEGLAVLTEILTQNSTPTRILRLVQRVRAITLAEDGANFIEVFDYLRQAGCNEHEAWTIAMRAFRGSSPVLKPFTKDLTYLKGFVLTFNYMRLAMATGKIRGLPLLFAGKLNIEDIPTYVDLLDAGVLKAPDYLPPYLQDLRGLAAWFSFSRFMAGLNFDQLERDFLHLLR